MNELESQKKLLREAWRRDYPRDARERDDYSAKICTHLKNCDEMKAARQVAVFAGMAWEPDLRAIWEANPMKCLFPRVAGVKLEFFPIATWDDLKPGFAGILEPTRGKLTPATWSAEDLILVPGYAFDRQGGRIGSGKGFYDRFLEGLSTPKWGVCHSRQILDDKLAQGSLDVRMDAVVSERGIVRV